MIKREKNNEGAWVWRFDIRVGGRRIRETGFEDRDDCLAAVSSIRADYKRGKYKFPADRRTVSIARAKDLYVGHLQRQNRSPDHMGKVKHAFTLLAEVVPLDRPVTEVTSKTLSKLIERRANAGAKAKTIINQVSAIISALRYAKKELPEIADWVPPARPEELKSTTSGRKRFISYEEEAEILKHLESFSQDAADVFIIALRTGMRLGEIIALKWMDIYTERSPAYPYGWLIARATKTGNRTLDTTDDRLIPISETLRDIFARRRKKTTGEFVFEHRTGHVQECWNARYGLQQACELAKIPYGRDVLGGLVFHDTRHTAISRMIASGVDLATVMEIAGHKQIKTTFIYTHTTAASKYAAVNLLDVHLESKADADQTQSDQSKPKPNRLLNQA